VPGSEQRTLRPGSGDTPGRADIVGSRGVEAFALGSNAIPAWILFAAVSAAPLPFGSTDPSVLAVWCLALGMALMTSSTRRLRPHQIAPMVGSAIVIVAYLLVMHEQLADHPWSGVAAKTIWDQAAALLGTQIPPSISIVNSEPYFAVGAPLAALLALSASCVICSDPLRARQLLRVISWSALAYAVLGIVLFLVDPTKVLWRNKVGYLSNLTGPFTNRNTAAVYFGSGACITMLLLLQELRSYRAGGKRRISKIFTSADTAIRWRVGRLASFVVVLIAALFMTASRAGVVISLSGLVFAFTAFWWRDLTRRRSVLLALAASAALAIIVLQLLGGNVGARFNENGVTDAARFDIYRSTLHMIANSPWLGSGLGTFAWAFPPYRDSGSVYGVVDRAHNTLLEIAAEMGVPFACLIALAWICIMAVLVHGVRVRRRGLITPVAALAVAAISVLHSMVDFSLQISGFAIMVFSLIGAGIAQSFRTPPAEAVVPSS